MRWRLVGLAVLTLALCAGCGPTVEGPASITLKDGTVIQCPRGFSFQKHEIYCYHRAEERYSMIDWRVVKGFRFGDAR